MGKEGNGKGEWPTHRSPIALPTPGGVGKATPESFGKRLPTITEQVAAIYEQLRGVAGALASVLKQIESLALPPFQRAKPRATKKASGRRATRKKA